VLTSARAILLPPLEDALARYVRARGEWIQQLVYQPARSRELSWAS